MIKPPPLSPGDRVALVAPAGRWDDERLARGMEVLERWGLRVDGPDRSAPVRYMSAADEVRAAAIARALADDDVRALLAVRGGFGSARLHADLPLSAASERGEQARGSEEARPVGRAKIVVGFSDISVLLNRIVQETGTVCYHGPMIAADLPRLDEGRRERFRRFLFGEEGWWDGSVSQVWRDGEASGPLLGGCLSVLVTTLGTPYEIRTEGSVLFLEDVAEKPYRIDRMLTHMKHAGKLDGIVGLVLGPMLDCDDGQGPALVREIVMDVLGERDLPVAYGLDAGHGAGNVVLPLGCRVRLDTEHRRLDLLERALAPAETPARAAGKGAPRPA